MSTTVEVFDSASSTWESISYNSARINRGIGSVRVAPSATVRTSRQAITAGQGLRISIDGSIEFEGSVVDPKRKGSGELKITAENDAVDVFDAGVSVNLSSPTDADVLAAALSAAPGPSLTLNYAPVPISLSDSYQVDDRSVKRIFRDMMDRGGRVWRVEGSTVHVENLGGRGQWQTVDTTQGGGGTRVREYSPGSKKTLRNRVRVNGTGGENVVGTAENSASVSQYGEQFEELNVGYISSKAEADAYASELLIPQPLSQAKLAANTAAGDIAVSHVNQTVTISDEATGIDGETFVIEGQTLEPQQAVFDVGEGSGVDIENVNRESKSQDDKTAPGTVIGTDRLADDSVDTPQLVDTAVIEQKIADLAVSETKVGDDAISTPKLQAGAVTASEILAGTITAGEIATGTLTANEIDTLDLDTNQLTVGFTNTSGGIEFGIQTGTSLGDIAVMEPTANQAASVGQTGNRFWEGWFANLGFNTATMDPGTAPSVEFDFDTNFNTNIYPETTDSRLGTDSNLWGEIYGSQGIFDSIRLDPGTATGTPIVTEPGLSGTELIPDTNGDCKIGNGNFEFDEIHAETFISGGNTLAGSSNPTYDTVSLNELKPDDPSNLVLQFAVGDGYPQVIPRDLDNGNEVWDLGTFTRSFNNVYSNNFTTTTPERIRSKIDYDDIVGHRWRSPPEYMAQKAGDGTYRWSNPSTEGVDLGHAANYLFEVTKSQSETISEQREEIETLQETVADLEARLSALESGANT